MKTNLDPSELDTAAVLDERAGRSDLSVVDVKYASAAATLDRLDAVNAEHPPDEASGQLMANIIHNSMSEPDWERTTKGHIATRSTRNARMALDELGPDVRFKRIDGKAYVAYWNDRYDRWDNWCAITRAVRNELRQEAIEQCGYAPAQSALQLAIEMAADGV